MNIRQATTQYEAWLAAQIRPDLRRKPGSCLYKAAKIMEQQVCEDWDEWR